MLLFFYLFLYRFLILSGSHPVSSVVGDTTSSCILPLLTSLPLLSLLFLGPLHFSVISYSSGSLPHCSFYSVIFFVLCNVSPPPTASPTPSGDLPHSAFPFRVYSNCCQHPCFQYGSWWISCKRVFPRVTLAHPRQQKQLYPGIEYVFYADADVDR